MAGLAASGANAIPCGTDNGKVCAPSPLRGCNPLHVQCTTATHCAVISRAGHNTHAAIATHRMVAAHGGTDTQRECAKVLDSHADSLLSHYDPLRDFGP